MSESETMNLAQPVPAVETASPGALLRAERERQGLHIAALAVVLKVPQAKLEALEADRFDLLSDTVFLRALASSMCRALKIDATVILANLPKPQVVHIKTDQAGLNTPFQRGHIQLIDTLKSYLKQPLGFGVFLLLLITLLIVFFPLSNSPVESVPTPAQTSSAPSGVPMAASSDPVVPPSVSASQTLPDVSAQASASSSPAVVASSTPVALVEVDVLSLRALGSAWVEVSDAKANVLLRRHMGTGETILLQGFLPLSVVLGRADLMVVKVRGKVLDVSPWSTSNVARFEVN